MCLLASDHRKYLMSMALLLFNDIVRKHVIEVRL